MKRLLQPHFQSIAAGIGIYVLFFSIVIFSVNVLGMGYPRNFVARALMGFLTYFPFLAAGYYTAVRSHPAGVF